MSEFHIIVDRNRYCSDISRAMQEPRIGTANLSHLHIVVALKRHAWPSKLESLGHGAEPEDPTLPVEDITARVGVFARIAAGYAELTFSARECDAPDGTLWVFPMGYRYAPEEVDHAAQFRALIEAGMNDALSHHVREQGDHFIMVCTHHERDMACGFYSKPVIRALKSAAPADVHIWEISHIGQHRFAATMIVQPQNRWYGGLTPADAAPLMDAITSGRVLTAFSRGSANYAAHEQVAENWAWSYFDSIGRVGEIVSIYTEALEPTSGHASVLVTLKDGNHTSRTRLTLRGSAYEFITNSVKRGEYVFESERAMNEALNPTKIRMLWQITRIVPLGE